MPLSACKEIIDFRIDANTYKKEYLESHALLVRKANKSISEIAYSVQNFGAYSLCNFINFQDHGIPFLMTKNVRENYIDWNIEKHIDAKSHQMLWKSHCKRGQVLVTMAGEYLGRVAVYDRDEVVSSNQAIAKVTLKPDYSSHFVSTFLNSRYGQHQIQRFKTITGQPNINMGLIEALRVPLLSATFVRAVERAMNTAGALREKAFTVYEQCETVLLNRVGMTSFSESREAISIKSMQASFGLTGRIDAEYYQPKYEQVVNKIVAQEHAGLSSLVEIQKSIEPGSDVYTDDADGLPFLRVADYSKFGITKPQKNLNAAFVEEYGDQLAGLKPKKGTILFSKDGSVGEAYCLRENAEFITSGAILHLTVRDTKAVLPDYLTLALNSKLVKMQAERDAGGSIILHWRPSEIASVVVPLVDITTQQDIARMVQESFALKAQSDHLLEVARRAVEIAIENDDAAALTFLAKEGA